MKDVELELVKEESTFIVLGLEVEELQCLLELEVCTRKQATTYQELEFVKRRTVLIKKIQRLWEMQNIFMPGLRNQLSQEQLQAFNVENRKEPESIKLFLPSGIANARAQGAAYAPGIADIEAWMRFAEASETLETIWTGLRMWTKANTHAQGMQHQVDVRIHAGKLRYRVLEDEDVHALNERAMSKEERASEERLRRLGMMNTLAEGGVAAAGVIMIGEAHKTLSWIWYNGGITGTLCASDPQQQAAVNEKWCKARARVQRWQEEIVMLEEEMHRMLEFSLWQARGLVVYVAERANTEKDRQSMLEAKWKVIRENAQKVLAGLDAGEVIEVELTVEDMKDREEQGGNRMDDDDEDE
ncbi:hypothetical protein C8J57DRAFT_1536868 [Mycena rebaudengoi]|nr:hypothetical protein C8J57DRAFT_1536868 [Mycena rebaudengoi]